MGQETPNSKAFTGKSSAKIQIIVRHLFRIIPRI